MVAPTLQWFDAAQTAAALPFDRLIDALRRQFIAGGVTPPRQILPVSAAPDAVWMIMPAMTDQYLGLKSLTVHPANEAQPRLHACYVLHDARDGTPLALIDGGELTARRTAAVSALAASMLARPDAHALCIVGAGRVAGCLADAYRAVLPIDELRIWNRSAERAERLALRCAATGVKARAFGALAEAVQGADIISSATMSTEPLIRADWLRPGMHVDLIGGFAPAMVELEPAAFSLADASVYVDTTEALVKAGDLLRAIDAGCFDGARLRATLAQLCADSRLGRPRASAITIFKSVGTALADLAAAAMVHQRGGSVLE